jgi:thiol-disulfide isomerase/thioredoxin
MPKYFEEIGNPEEFGEELKNNPGMIVIKFGATWCKPCKKVESLVQTSMLKLPTNYKCFIIDIDECFELYAFLKTKRMVNGIPSILAWKKGNTSTIPDAVVASSKDEEVNSFFQQCLLMAS